MNQISLTMLQVFTAQNAHKVFEVACPFASGWGGGVFVDDVNLLLWTRVRGILCCLFSVVVLAAC